MISFSVRSTFHDLSAGTGPASISDAPSPRGAWRVLKRRRTVRGLTKVIENGSAGFSSYSVPGNSVPLPLPSVRSILLKESVVPRTYLSHRSSPWPVAGSKSVTLLPTK